MKVFTSSAMAVVEASRLEAAEFDVEDLMKAAGGNERRDGEEVDYSQSQSSSGNFSQKQRQSRRPRNRRCGNDSWRRRSNFLRCSLFLLFGLICADVTVTRTAGLKINSNGGYEDLVVTIGNDVPPIACQQLVQNLQGILTSTSESLHHATKGKVYFHRIIIVLPPMYDTRACGKHIPPASFTSLSSIATAEFRVNVEHPVYGHAPFTQQSSGCSKPGDFISVGYQYIMQHNETEPGSTSSVPELLQNWAKFRYGVFEEKGLENDPIYPMLYHEGDSTGRTEEKRKPTSCTNRPLRGAWSGLCNGTGIHCVFTPSLTENDNVTSSIMSSVQLPHVKNFCDGGTHKPLSPTKHNFMCRQKSVEEVIFSHPDFRNLTPSPRNGRGVPAPHFIIKQLTQPRWVLIVEETGNMNLRDVWKYLKLAVRKFIKYDLPTGTQIGLMTVSTDVRLLANMTSLQDDNNLRGALAEKLPNYPSIETSSGGLSLRKGISQAINMLKTNGQRVAGSVIVLISQGTISPMDLEASLQLLRQEEVSITTIEYPSAGDGKISFLSQGTNSPHYSIRESGVGTMSHMSTYIQLVNSLLDIQRFFTKGIAAKWPTLIHQEEFKGDAPSYVKSSFSYDSSQTPGSFYIYVPNPIDPKVNTVELESPSKAIFTDQLSYLHDINVIKIDAQINEPGVWKYKIQRLGDSHQSHFVQVLTSGGNAEDLNVRLFSNVEESRTVNLAHMPLILFADVKRGSSPVIGADVEALVNGNWSVPLLDNGNGDPDLTKGDGVYSRYIIPTVASQTAWLDITVTVKTTPFRSHYVGPDTSGKVGPPPQCCGSGLRPLSPTSLRTMPYNERIVYSYMVKVINAQDPGTYPPSRIGDLRVVQSYDTRVVLEFTSPGDDYDHGLPHKYQVYSSVTRRMLPIRTEDILTTSQAGSTVNITISLPGYRMYFLSVVAVDRGHRSGESSNIVEVRTLPPPSDNFGGHGVAGNSELQMNGDASATADGSDGDSGLSTTELILIIAGAVGFLIIVLALIICIYCRRRSTKGMGSTDTKISTISDTKAPIHWSASELLQEHEKRQSIYAQSTQGHPHHPASYGYNGVQNPGGGRHHHEGGGSPGSSTRSFRSISENRKTSLDSMSGRRATLTDYESCSSDPTLKSVKGQTDYDTPPDSDQDNYRTIDSYPIHPPPYKVPAGGIMTHYPQRMINSHSHMQYNPNLQGSLTSVNSKKRNITMV